jgi:hypothetical protein
VCCLSYTYHFNLVSDLHDGAGEETYGVGNGETKPAEAEVRQDCARAGVPDTRREEKEKEREKEKGMQRIWIKKDVLCV